MPDRRINLEKKWFSDPRRHFLAERLSQIYTTPGVDLYIADGLALAAWKMAQDFWAGGRRQIPLSLFKKLTHHDLLLECGLAEEKRNFIYVNGTKEFHEWAARNIANGAKGGLSKAKKSSDSLATLKRLSSDSLASISISSSISSSSSKNKKKDDDVHVFLDSKKQEQDGQHRHPLFEIWNTHRGGMRLCSTIDPKRLTLADNLWRANPDRQYWQNIVTRLAANPYCCGQGDSGWIADFDFFVRPDTHLRVLEGKYDQFKKKKKVNLTEIVYARKTE